MSDIEDTPFMRRARERGKVGHGTASERRLAKAMGSRLNPASGATQGAKGDARLKAKVDFRIESKSTTAESLRLERHWLSKIRQESFSCGETPALTVSFVNGDGSPKPDGDWVMIPLSTFRELTA